MKICNKCNLEKDINCFSFRNKTKKILFKTCKTCLNIYAKKYREENKIKIKEKTNEWYQKKGHLLKKEYEKINKNKINEKNREKYKTDKKYRMQKIMRTRFKKTIKNKNKSFLIYLDCTIDFLNKWLEFQFDDKMTWENQGSYWDIDHVIPCSSFDLSVEEEIKKCFNWKNLRPLNKIENYKKNNKIIEEIINLHFSKAVNYEKESSTKL